MSRAVLSLIAVITLLGSPAHAQAWSGEIDGIFGFATQETPGCAVGVSQRGELVVNRAYGSADLERRVPMSPSSIFDVGSVRKQFVAAAVLLLVEEGRLSLSDDIREHFPELPDYGQQVTVDHLLTHTSGMRDWTGLAGMVGPNADIVSLIVRQRGLDFAPGEEWAYSNSGYVLLTDLVARTSGMSFSDFTRERLFEPLGMRTTLSPADLRTVIENRALGYEREGTGWRVGMYVGNERGSGGGAVLTTAADLVLWNDALTSGRLGTFVTEKLQEQARLNNGRKLSYARGLMVGTYRGGPLVSHSGGAAGYSAWSGRLPSHGISIAVLCNADVVSASGLASRVGDVFLNALGAPAAEPRATGTTAAVAVAGIDVEGRAGLFFSERDGRPLRLVVNSGRLQIVGGEPLIAVGADRFRNPRGDLFFLSQDEFELWFTTPDRFELRSMEGETTRYRRAHHYAPTPEELRAFTGRYESEEIGTVVRIVPETNRLVGRLAHSPEQALEFAPVEPDTFQFSGVTLRFHRDGSGQVVAFDYSNPVVRSIRFTRLNDSTRLP